jgi:hypothetical protein
VLERVNGEPADLLIQSSGGERVLQGLEEANAFVVSLDAARSWFRYHHLFVGPRSAGSTGTCSLVATSRPRPAPLPHLCKAWVASSRRAQLMLQRSADQL